MLYPFPSPFPSRHPPPSPQVDHYSGVRSMTAEEAATCDGVINWRQAAINIAEGKRVPSPLPLSPHSLQLMRQGPLQLARAEKAAKARAEAINKAYPPPRF